MAWIQADKYHIVLLVLALNEILTAIYSTIQYHATVDNAVNIHASRIQVQLHPGMPTTLGINVSVPYDDGFARQHPTTSVSTFLGVCSHLAGRANMYNRANASSIDAQAQCISGGEHLLLASHELPENLGLFTPIAHFTVVRRTCQHLRQLFRALNGGTVNDDLAGQWMLVLQRGDSGADNVIFLSSVIWSNLICNIGSAGGPTDHADYVVLGQCQRCRKKSPHSRVLTWRLSTPTGHGTVSNRSVHVPYAANR